MRQSSRESTVESLKRPQKSRNDGHDECNLFRLSALNPSSDERDGDQIPESSEHSEVPNRHKGQYPESHDDPSSKARIGHGEKGIDDGFDDKSEQAFVVKSSVGDTVDHNESTQSRNYQRGWHNKPDYDNETHPRRRQVPNESQRDAQEEQTVGKGRVVNGEDVIGLHTRDVLRDLMADDGKRITATLSVATKGDVGKGRAVKRQREGFDALLNTRIKLQKGVTASNQLAVTGAGAREHGQAVQSAEDAALALWATIEDLRLALLNAQATDESKKRKPASSTQSAASLWKRMADLEAESVAHRRAVLDKWSLKVRGSNATMPNSRGKLLGSSAGQQNITSVLDAQIASEVGDRAAKRARTESNGHDTSEPVYDDTVFYQSLLRDLVEQRMSSDSTANGFDALHIQLRSRPAVHPVTGMRNDKNRKEIDTRASKGRKMRFHVHEKLQNFMAPEDRSTWTDRARDEFFASLLGKTASGLLREGDDASGESDDDVEEGGLRLFRG